MATSRWQLAAAVLALVGGCHAGTSRLSVPPTDSPAGRAAVDATAWFDDLGEPLTILDNDARALMFHVARQVRGAHAPPGLPAKLRADARPRIVFLSVSDGLRPARVVMGTGPGLVKAVERAASAFAGLGRDAPEPKWVRLDIVQRARAVAREGPYEPLALDNDLGGLACSRDSGIALLAAELSANRLIERRRLQPERIRAYLRDRRGANWAAWLVASREKRVWRFSTLGLFTDGTEVVRLSRGRRDFSQLTRKDLLAAADLGGQYLIRAVRKDGRFVYSYRADTGEASEKYNILRHAGTVYAMLALHEVTRDRRLLEAAAGPVRYLLRSVRPGLEDKENTACVVEGGYVKLGGNALAALALVKYTEVTGDRSHVPVILKLARWITACQAQSGDFLIHKQAYPGGRVQEFISYYYPGEAMLALARVHRIDPKGKWLDSAERAARHLIDVRDRDEIRPDQWQLYALNELYRLRRDEKYLRQALRIARLIVRTQRRAHENPDWVGSFLDPPRSTPTAVRMEALCAAHGLARDFGRGEQAGDILEAIRLGTAFQLRAQVRPESAMYLNDPQRALGGIRGSLTTYRIRIDYVQHTISSLLGLYRILGQKPS